MLKGDFTMENKGNENLEIKEAAASCQAAPSGQAEASGQASNTVSCPASKEKKLLGAVIIAVVAMLAINLAFTGVVAAKVLKEDEFGDSEDPAKENGVVIMGEYTIQSTENISDAYKSGNDSSLDNIGKSTLEMASKVLDEIIEDDMTDYEKEKAVYEWMVTNCTFDDGMLIAVPTTQDYSATPYGVLKNHTGVCVGYATTFRLFMQMLDIECMVVHSSDLGHSWDIVKLDDGNWYHVDIYMDISSNGGYESFNMNDIMCSHSHNWNQDFFPAAEGKKYNYAYVNSETLDDIYTLPEKVKNTLDENDGRGSLFYKFDSAEEKENFMLASNMAGIISDRVNEQYPDTYVNTYGCDMGDGEYLLCIYMINYNDSGNSSGQGISEEDYQKLQDTVDEVFSGGGDADADAL